MNKETITMLEELAVQLNIAVDTIIDYYASYIITQSLVIIGIIGITVFALMKIRIIRDNFEYEYEYYGWNILRYFVVFLLSLLIGGCFIDLLNPEAAAIKSLLGDLTK